jgi:hypothetical protein
VARVTGHIRLAHGKRGDTWFAKYRRADGQQVQRKLGPAHTGPGRPPAGYFTKRTAQEALDAILTDERRGTTAAHESAEATFADAAAEYLRFVQDVRQRESSTVGDYKGVIDGYLLEEFGTMALAAITADHIDRYKERLIADGRLSNRTIVRHLTVLHGIFKRAKRVWGLRDNPASAELVERPQVVYTGEFQTLDRDGVLLLAASGGGHAGRGALSHGGHDRAPPGRAAGAPVARRRLRGRSGARAPQLDRSHAQDPEGEEGPQRADGPGGRRRARPA